MSSKLKTAIQMYNDVFTDEALVRNLVGLIGEIIDRKHPSDTRLGMFYTVGEIADVKGFYTDSWLVFDVAGGLIGRAFKMCCNHAGVDLSNPSTADRVFNFLLSTDAQQIRIVPNVIDRCIATYGDPKVVDDDKLDAIKSRYGDPLTGLN